MKPEILSDEQITNAIDKAIIERRNITSWRVTAQAQLDADVAYYEPLIQQAKEETIQGIAKALRNPKHPLYQEVIKEIETTIQQVAREIFEEVERERFAEPQYIPQAGKEPVIITLTEDTWQEIKSKYGGQK
jgi:hypothetical protein